MSHYRAAVLSALVFTAFLPGRLFGQAGAPAMTPTEREAYDMGLEMAFVCNPQRHRAMTASQSMIEREGEPLAGTATYLRTAEGTFFVLEGYDESQAGHCLVLAWFGGALEPGPYRIRRLASAAMEEELDSGEHSFFVFSAVRAPDESATLVTETGALEIESAEPGSVVGSFELTGFTISSQERVDDVVLRGSFTALDPAR